VKHRARIVALLAALTVLGASTAYAVAVYKTSTPISLAAIDATGSATIQVGRAGYSSAQIGIRVTARAGWAGTVTATVFLSDADTVGEPPITVNLAALTATGAGGADGTFGIDIERAAHYVVLDVTGNNRVLTAEVRRYAPTQ
jgi:hypothetical protein